MERKNVVRNIILIILIINVLLNIRNLIYLRLNFSVIYEHLFSLFYSFQTHSFPNTYLAVNYFCKNLHLRYLTGFWMHLWLLQTISEFFSLQKHDDPGKLIYPFNVKLFLHKWFVGWVVHIPPEKLLIL